MLAFGGFEKLAIFQRGPPELVGGDYFMVGKCVAQRGRCALIEQNAHLGGSQCAAGGMLQDCAHLLRGHTREPFHELRHLGAVFQVLEEGRYRYTCAPKHPGAADALRIALDHRAGGPVNHVRMLTPGEGLLPGREIGVAQPSRWFSNLPAIADPGGKNEQVDGHGVRFQ